MKGVMRGLLGAPEGSWWGNEGVREGFPEGMMAKLASQGQVETRGEERGK